MGKRALPVILLALMVILGAVGFGFPQQLYSERLMTENRALARAGKFVEAVNANNPAQVYQYLSPQIKGLIDQKGFVANFTKERSYPYLTPLYLYIEGLELQEDKKTGQLECIVAARLPGQKMSFRVLFEEGDYYLVAFEDIANGSFLDKFARLSGGGGDPIATTLQLNTK